MGKWKALIFGNLQIWEHFFKSQILEIFLKSQKIWKNPKYSNNMEKSKIFQQYGKIQNIPTIWKVLIFEFLNLKILKTSLKATF